MRALVVFHGKEARGFWLTVFTRPGFRHCFACVSDGREWIEIDARANGLSVRPIAPATFDMAHHYRVQGLTVIETSWMGAAGADYRWPWAFTCVELVKRLLGIRAWRIWTPYGLYRRLSQ